MSKVIIKNVVSVFQFDTFIASMSGEKLEDYMMKKHGWTKEFFDEMKQLYMDEIVKSAH